MVFNAIFNNILVISWRSVLLVEETGVSGEKHWPVASHWQTLSHNVVSSSPHHERASNSQIYCLLKEQKSQKLPNDPDDIQTSNWPVLSLCSYFVLHIPSLQNKYFLPLCHNLTIKQGNLLLCPINKEIIQEIITLSHVKKSSVLKLAW